MPELRRQFRSGMADLEDTILEMGSRVLDMLDDCMRALLHRDVELAEAVIRADDLIDERYHRVREETFRILALQAPVANELRVLSALMYVNLHLERMGDLCVNIAKVARRAPDAPDEPGLLAQVEEMSVHTRTVVQRALDSLARRDAAMARTLPELDDPVDQLNRSLFRRFVQVAAEDDSRLDWAMRMVLVARYLERLSDHAVDIGEQTLFAVTGESVDLSKLARGET